MPRASAGGLAARSWFLLARWREAAAGDGGGLARVMTCPWARLAARPHGYRASRVAGGIPPSLGAGGGAAHGLRAGGGDVGELGAGDPGHHGGLPHGIGGGAR